MPETHSLHALRVAVARASQYAARHPDDPRAGRAVEDAREAYAVEKTLQQMGERLSAVPLSTGSRRRLVDAVMTSGLGPQADAQAA